MTFFSLRRFKVSLFRASLMLVASLAPVPAFADLIINPTRIVFENNQRSAQIDVINDGATPATYRLSLVNRRMTEAGEFKEVTSPGDGDQFASAILVYSPRQIVLRPGTQQLVRISLRKPADLPPGEYRSHLLFEKVADPGLANSLESQVKAAPNEVGVVITALIGASIPVIVRNGKTQASTTISDVLIEKPQGVGEPAILALQLNRVGTRSVYGDLTATFKTPAGKEQVVAQAGGVAVYVPNSVRRVRLNLQVPPDTLLSGGTLRVTFNERTEDSGKLIAESAIQLP